MSLFQEYFIDVLKYKYADFSGRAMRSEYWYFRLFYMLLFLMLYAGALIWISLGVEWIGYLFGALVIIYLLVLFVPNLAVAVRRLHDTGKSGWYLLIALIPLVGPILLLLAFIKDSDIGDNKWGRDPKELDAVVLIQEEEEEEEEVEEY